jgi:hypothetical protein
MPAEADPANRATKELHMKEETVLSRRGALQAGLGATASLIVAIAMPRPVRAAGTKLAKSVVQYVDIGKEPHMDCDDCIQFLPGKTAKGKGLCKIVEGDISPQGHCLAFSPKPKS